MEGLAALLGATARRVSSALAAPPAESERQLRVGLGGDVPVFPPLAAIALLLLAAALGALLGGRKRFLPPALAPLHRRVAVAGVSVAYALRLKDASERALEAAGSGLDFTVVNGVATAFPYSATRNPLYVALVASAAAVSVLLDDARALAAAAALAAYLDRVVVPAEEALLEEHFPEAFAALSSAPRWFSLARALGRT